MKYRKGPLPFLCNIKNFLFQSYLGYYLTYSYEELTQITFNSFNPI